MLLIKVHDLNFDEYPGLSAFLAGKVLNCMRTVGLKYDFFHGGKLKTLSTLEICAALGKMAQLCLILDNYPVDQNSLSVAFKRAAENGHLGIVNRLLEMDVVKANVV